MILGLSYELLALLFAAGALGTAINAVAGGGTLVTFPAFLAVGVPPVVANASNAVAIFPGRVLVVRAYRRELARHLRICVLTAIACLAGGFVGALLLLRSSDSGFLRAVPWLLLVATLLFAFDRRLARLARPRRGGPAASPGRIALVCLALFAISIYGGFFAAGLGLLMMPFLAVLGVDDMQELNGIKNLLVTVVTSVAVLSFIVAGAVSWPGTAAMSLGSLFGGYVGGPLARLMPAPVMRTLIIVFGMALSAYYFWKVYLV